LRYWRTAVENISPQDVDLVSAPVGLRDLFTVELIFAGELDLLTKQLMWRLAAFAGNGELGVDGKGIAAERQRFVDRFKLKPSKIGAWLRQIGRDEEWLEETLAMEVAYRGVREAVLNPQARNKQLAVLRMPLTRFEAEVIELESLEAAREA